MACVTLPTAEFLENFRIYSRLSSIALEIWVLMASESSQGPGKSVQFCQRLCCWNIQSMELQ